MRQTLPGVGESEGGEDQMRTLLANLEKLVCIPTNNTAL